MSSTKSSNRRQQKASRRFNLIAVVVVVVGVLLIAAIVISASGGDDDGSGDGTALGDQTATVLVNGDPLPLFSPESDPSVGSTAPTLAGQDFAATPVEISDDGRIKAIAFVAHWCPHCQAELPRLRAYLDANGLPEGVDLYIVPTSTDENQPNYPPQPWLEREGLGDLPTLVDDGTGSAFAAHGGTGFPFWVFLDSDQRVLGRLSGEFPSGTFERIFPALAEEQPITPELAFATSV